MTHLIAKQLFIIGKIDEAWEVARLDDGMRPDVTRTEWEAFMVSCIKSEGKMR